MCVIFNNNNDPNHRHPYVSSAHWVLNSDRSGQSLDIDILKCRIKNTFFVHQNKTFQSNKHLFIDLIRVRKIPHVHASRSSSSNSSLSVSFRRNLVNSALNNSDSTSSNSDPKHTVISFSIPWNTRYAGYPFSQSPHRMNISTRQNPWENVGIRNNKKSKHQLMVIALLFFFLFTIIMNVVSS